MAEIEPGALVANRQIARATGIVMGGFLLSTLTGLARTILIANGFGTESALDAFNAAIRLPDTLFTLVAGGALASAFIPTFVGFLEKGDREGAWKLASAVMNLVSLVMVLCSLMAFFFAPQIVQNILATKFDPGQQALTTSLLRIMLVSPVIFGVSGLLMGILNAHQHFLLPVLASTMNSMGYILAVVFLTPRFGVYGLAWGSVLGAALHLAVQLPGLRQVRWQYAFTLGLDLPAVREVARLMAPRLLGVAAVQLNFWINVILATGMPAGSLTSIDYAWRIMMMPQIVIAQAIAVAALPTFSAQAARGALGEMRTSLAATLRGVLLLSFPVTVGIILLRNPIVAMFFQRGVFDAESTRLVAWALLWYTCGLVAHSVVEIISRAFYALRDTLTPVLVGTLAMGLNIGLSLLIAGWFSIIGLPPHGGLALANSIATTLEMGILLLMMRKRLGGLDGRKIIRGLGLAGLASAIMATAILGWLAVFPDGNYWIVGIGGIALGGVVYGVGTLALKVEESKAMLDFLWKKIRK